MTTIQSENLQVTHDNNNSNDHDDAFSPLFDFPDVAVNDLQPQPPTISNATLLDREQQRTKRFKEEAVRRLVSDVNRTATTIQTTFQQQQQSLVDFTANNNSSSSANIITSQLTFEQQAQQQDELLISSTIATAIERNLDRELHTQLTKQMKESASSISKICHEHSDSFLNSVGKVVELGPLCTDIKHCIDLANLELEEVTVKPMLESVVIFEYMKQVVVRAKSVYGVVKACKEVALLLERARKQAELARPRSALDAVDEARNCLSASLRSLVLDDSTATTITADGNGGIVGASGASILDLMEHDLKAYFDILLSENEILLSNTTTDVNNNNNTTLRSSSRKLLEDKTSSSRNISRNSTSTTTTTDAYNNNNINPSPSNTSNPTEKNDELRLEDTPFGSRSISILPKIENQVLTSARRGLNKWFLSIRSGGDGAKAGRAALRKCAYSLAIGPGQLGLGGNVQGYTWRAKHADNLISRVSQNGIVVKAVRMGYWFDRDNRMEIERLERVSGGMMGMERRAEAFASAFGWYRCWDEEEMLEVEELRYDNGGGESSLTRSGHGLSMSSHSFKRSSHGGSGGLQTSSSRHGKSISYHATNLGAGKKGPSQWSIALTPSVLLDGAPYKTEDEMKLLQIPNSVYPVRRAEAAFALQGRQEEFRQYYEQNRFGDMKIGEKTDDDGFERETRSSLSSLTGDDVSQGTDRIFFARNLPHLCSSVVGFSTIEAALELGNHQQYDENGDSEGKVRDSGPTVGGIDEPTMSFRDSSARYERKLISELGYLLRGRAIGATLVELSRASCLMAAFRSALKIVHPNSPTRNFDKDLIAMDVDILMTALKVAQEEQRRATARILLEDDKEPVPVPLEKTGFRYTKDDGSTNAIPDEEVKGFPFGLSEQKLTSNTDKQTSDLSGIGSRRGIYQSFDEKDTFNFSRCVPLIVKAIHSRAIAFAAFASSQEELGQVFERTSKKGGGISGYVLDCVEQLIVLAAVGIKENNQKPISNVQEAVQIMANITALKLTLPRLFGVIMRGLFHLGMARGDQLEESFEYAESTLAKADEYCESQSKSIVNTIHGICQNKVDELLRFSLENFQWVARSARDSPNTYCEGLIDYLRTIFKILKMLDDGTRAMLYFSVCGHVTERMVNIIAGKIDDNDKSNAIIGPITKIDAFGIKNLSNDVQALESFADGTGLPQLSTCFQELRWLTDALLDPDLPTLLQRENENTRRRKHPFLQLDLIANVLEKYQGSGGISGMLGGSNTSEKFLMLEKKEVATLLKVVRAQIKLS